MEDCFLRPMQERDLRLVLEWRNSPRIANRMYTENKIEWQEHIAWFEQCMREKERKNFIFCIHGEAVGVVNFTEIDWQNKRCSWGIYIGKENAPRGSGTQMGRKAIVYAFQQMNLQKIWVEVLRENTISLKFHEKIGFRSEGCFRRHILKNGKYMDVIRMACLKQI